MKSILSDQFFIKNKYQYSGNDDKKECITKYLSTFTID